MNQYFLGVDVGATKSHALIADQAGRAVGLGLGGPGNHEVVGYHGFTEVLKAITDDALAMAGLSKKQLAGAGFGIGGYDWPAEKIPIQQAIETLGLAAPYEFVNDTLIGLIAGATEGWGVAVVAGTGNNCWGRDRHGRKGRVTGRGAFLGEYAGASELVMKAIQVVALAWTQRGPATRLTEAFIDLTGAADSMDLLEGLSLDRYQLTAAAAPVIFQVAAAGDEVAQALIEWAGRELGSLATGVIRQLALEPLEFEVVLIGSLYQGSPRLIETMAATIHAVAPQARLVRLLAPPVIGGVLLGMEQAGLNDPRLRPALITSSNVILAEMRNNQR